MLFVDYIIVLPLVFTYDIEWSFIERSCALNKKKCAYNLVIWTKKIGNTDLTKTKSWRMVDSSSFFVIARTVAVVLIIKSPKHIVSDR